MYKGEKDTREAPQSDTPIRHKVPGSHSSYPSAKTERHRFREYQGGCLVTDKLGGMGLWFTEEELPEAIEILKKFQPLGDSFECNQPNCNWFENCKRFGCGTPLKNVQSSPTTARKENV